MFIIFKTHCSRHETHREFYKILFGLQAVIRKIKVKQRHSDGA